VRDSLGSGVRANPMAGILLTGMSPIVGGGTGGGGGAPGGVAIGSAVTGGTAGSVLFVTTGGVLSQDNTGFFYDDVDHQLLINAGTAPKPSLIFGDDTTGFYRPALDQVAVALGGVAAVRFGAIGPDADITFAMGRVLMDSRVTDRMHISHRDQGATTNFAINQTATGGTQINSAAGQTCGFSIANNTKWAVNGTTFEFQPGTDNAFDIGATAQRVRRHFLAEYFEYTEMTAPAAPAVNKVRIFAVDNAGKTQLMALFNTGAAQSIALEP
jgi:hypothetical protein